MFGGNNSNNGGNSKPSSSHHFDTLISAKAEIVGDMHFAGGLHIDGKIFGNIIAEDNSGAIVRISENGVVVGEISAPHVVVNGSVTGDVHACEHLELASKAKIKGDVYYNMIEMVMGSQVSGQLRHSYRGKPEDRPEMPKHVTQEKPVLETETDPKVKTLPVKKTSGAAVNQNKDGATGKNSPAAAEKKS